MMAQALPKHRAREYETIFIINPDVAGDIIDDVAGRLTGVVERLEGKLLKAENWGRRRLAYPIRKHARGVYIYLRYLGYSDLVHELERNLRMIEPVIKYLTVKVDEDVNPEARPVEDGDISFAPAFEDEPEAPADEPADGEGDEESAEGEDDGEDEGETEEKNEQPANDGDDEE